jgi:prepilin-type N-terminal cleavage/methylation domain-containing protein
MTERSGIMLAKPQKQRTTDNGQRTSRRGVTLVEMLVTVAVLVIMMTILVQIFQAATGSVSAAQAYQAIDDQLRRLDGLIRADLEGVTARFTPPLDPALNLGYFEYGENEFADNQGEDGDDYIRFTAKAPAGRPFTGRMFIPPSQVVLAAVANGTLTNAQLQAYLTSQPVTITSDYAEIIYFLRNGNLYRRIFLVVPDLQSAIAPAVNNTGVYQLPGSNPTTYAFQPSIFRTSNGLQNVSWLGVNDLSAHPAPSGPNLNATPNALTQAQSTIILNTLGHLTNRENRAFYPRFASDFFNADPTSGNAGPGVDGIPDDFNLDNVPDLYPSLYPGVIAPASGGTGPPSNSVSGGSNVLVFEPNPNSTRWGVGFLAFPFVFPGAYSQAQVVSSNALGWIHAPAPLALDPNGTTTYQFDTQPNQYLQFLNHNPLDIGDNLPFPNSATPASQTQTWWGFPTWRETLSPNWNDPTVQVNVGPNFGTSVPQTPVGLTYSTFRVNTGKIFPWPGGDLNLLPPMVSSWTVNGTTTSIPGFRNVDQPFCDGAGSSSAFVNATLWPLTWEDDLIMTGVRSFDVKAYDNALANYADLGWMDDARLYAPYQNVLTGAFMPNPPNVALPMIAGTPATFPWPPVNPQTVPTTPIYATLQTMGHEGRMPPLINDNRLDAQFGAPTYLPSNSPYLPANQGTYTGNVGDDNNGVVRLRRVWDSWSTDYSRAPGTGVNKAGGGFPWGPPFTPPIYPSYPPPYPAPLRGLQIQIRVVDPTNQRIKSLTIRQDFTDKL